MKLLFLIVLTCIALSVSVRTEASDLLAAQPGQPLRMVGGSASAAMSKTDVPICYIQWTNSDRLVNLTQLCGKQPQDLSRSQITYPQPPAPYDQSAIKKFDDSVYGDGK